MQVAIGLENHTESRELLRFTPSVTPNPTLLSQWILNKYSTCEINELVLMIQH